MEIPIACASCLRDDDLMVLELLRNSDRLLTVEELTALTGFSADRVKRSLRKIAQQAAMARRRSRLGRGNTGPL